MPMIERGDALGDRNAACWRVSQRCGTTSLIGSLQTGRLSRSPGC